jgi:hypothetical protein
MPDEDTADLRAAYDEGFAAAQRGEEAAPGCTANERGRAFLRGYIDGRAALREPARSRPIITRSARRSAARRPTRTGR